MCCTVLHMYRYIQVLCVIFPRTRWPKQFISDPDTSSLNVRMKTTRLHSPLDKPSYNNLHSRKVRGGANHSITMAAWAPGGAVLKYHHNPKPPTPRWSATSEGAGQARQLAKGLKGNSTIWCHLLTDLCQVSILLCKYFWNSCDVFVSSRIKHIGIRRNWQTWLGIFMPVSKRTNQQTVSRSGDRMLKPFLHISLGTLVISQMCLLSLSKSKEP